MKDDMHLITEKFPNYSKSEKDFPVRYYYAFANEPSVVVYQRMADQLLAAATKKVWVPLLRMSHGEFTLCVGRPAPKKITQLPKYYLKNTLRRLGVMPMVDYRGNSKGDLNDGKSREKLTVQEFKQLKADWIAAMQVIGRQGIIAPAFNDRTSYVECIDGMIRFFNKNDIRFGSDNFAPMFGVYAFICGPDFRQLVAGRNVVAVTWLDEQRRKGIEHSCRQAGAATVNFIETSPHRAALETIDPAALPVEPDVALFACGLGAVPLIYQFRHTKAVCIDAGFALDVLANPELRGKRAWTLPDDLYDAFKGGRR